MTRSITESLVQRGFIDLIDLQDPTGFYCSLGPRFLHDRIKAAMTLLDFKTRFRPLYLGGRESFGMARRTAGTLEGWVASIVYARTDKPRQSSISSSSEVSVEPMLWRSVNGLAPVVSVMQPLTPKDFEACRYHGEAPLSDASEFAREPKYGGTGMAAYEGKLYVGSWNGVYVFSLPYLFLKLSFRTG